MFGRGTVIWTRSVLRRGSKRARTISTSRARSDYCVVFLRVRHSLRRPNFRRLFLLVCCYSTDGNEEGARKGKGGREGGGVDVFLRPAVYFVPQRLPFKYTAEPSFASACRQQYYHRCVILSLFSVSSFFYVTLPGEPLVSLEPPPLLFSV